PTLRGQTVAVLPFEGPNGPAAQNVVTQVVVTQSGASLVPPSTVDRYLMTAGFRPSAYDPGGLELKATRIIWGAVNQFTPYHFNRLVPATPAYVEITFNVFS